MIDDEIIDSKSPEKAEDDGTCCQKVKNGDLHPAHIEREAKNIETETKGTELGLHLKGSFR